MRPGLTLHRGRPHIDIELRSGDLLVFGGPSRLACYGVPKTLPGRPDPSIGLDEGRLKVTLRVTGLPGEPGTEKTWVRLLQRGDHDRVGVAA